MTRRDLLRVIGLSAGGAAMYQAMSSLGLAAESPYKGTPKLQGAPHGASVLILGAGLAGMVAAYELRQAGYRVQLLEYNPRPGGRNWTLRGGDTYTEMGGYTQHCRFDRGLYFNPGPWRIPYHHRGLLDYCKKLGVPLEPFVQINHNAYLHGAKAFGGKPQRYRAINADYRGHVAELLAKATQQGKLDAQVSKDDQAQLLESLRGWGALDDKYAYAKGPDVSNRRGYDKPPGGGLSARPIDSQPLQLHDVLDSRLWRSLTEGEIYEFQTTLFQPVGGMGRIGEAFGRELKGLIHYNAKVTAIQQDERGVTASYVDARHPGAVRQARADWCICTIPLSILSQIPINVGAPMAAAIGAVPYAATVKVGLQFKRRFWEEDEDIYGGLTATDLPINTISYPSNDFNSRGKGVLLGAYIWGLDAYEFTAMSPDERIRRAVEYGSQIHPQYKTEFDNGVAVAWHRSPFTMGCFASWSEALRAKHYDNLCQIDRRIALAGEHVSYLPAWQEGAVTSALDAVERLHQRVMAGVAG
ncbi:flavin monoamine oxidase family protein [Dyella mobilis]|uniref:Tryptophan 2-monooxygenase n=1 Tax=Dyella mobilis TaxID=1849582 RepID=A0ABS2KMQ6_9GAMM|nr:flavin monoamine oxidase family protein [Dyella mobilis]MBM7132235.1 flavin monoamine oxidase family protein [Dyella mobilis]GLQ95779.1 flavin monoamine oxidase [Dyella mobilis]